VILAVTSEQRSSEDPSFFHPYYLDLAYGILYDREVQFQPTDLGQTPAELQIRFYVIYKSGIKRCSTPFVAWR
jgi:hypothetical protein